MRRDTLAGALHKYDERTLRPRQLCHGPVLGLAAKRHMIGPECNAVLFLCRNFRVEVAQKLGEQMLIECVDFEQIRRDEGDHCDDAYGKKILEASGQFEHKYDCGHRGPHDRCKEPRDAEIDEVHHIERRRAADSVCKMAEERSCKRTHDDKREERAARCARSEADGREEILPYQQDEDCLPGECRRIHELLDDGIATAHEVGQREGNDAGDGKRNGEPAIGYPLPDLPIERLAAEHASVVERTQDAAVDSHDSDERV